MPEPSGPTAASAPSPLTPRMSSPRALREIVRTCLAQIADQAAGVIAASDPEPVHQMRVGLRRLNSAIAMFERLHPCPAALRTELGWLAGALGGSRDWEVLAAQTLPALARRHDQHAAFAALEQAARARAAAGRARAVAAVASARYARLLETVERWGCGKRAGKRRTRLRAFAPDALTSLHKAMRRRGRHLDAPGPRHRLRIAAKRMRYALSFFAPLYPGRRTRRYLKRLAGLQDVLGTLNDLHVAQALLRELAGDDAPYAAGAALAAALAGADEEGELSGLAARWRRIRRARPL